ncbi:hypothetical protein C8R43DRAFT_956737 [Mycena crocata]|nr:hypothetical protein C8R43DRAFT_956737 [Mycena crocata]
MSGKSGVFGKRIGGRCPYKDQSFHGRKGSRTIETIHQGLEGGKKYLWLRSTAGVSKTLIHPYVDVARDQTKGWYWAHGKAESGRPEPWESTGGDRQDHIIQRMETRRNEESRNLVNPEREAEDGRGSKRRRDRIGRWEYGPEGRKRTSGRPEDWTELRNEVAEK